MITNLLNDPRFLILLLDGIIIVTLMMILTIRLIMRHLPKETITVQVPAKNSQKPKTIDQLNIDIPL